MIWNISSTLVNEESVDAAARHGGGGRKRKKRRQRRIRSYLPRPVPTDPVPTVILPRKSEQHACFWATAGTTRARKRAANCPASKPVAWRACRISHPSAPSGAAVPWTKSWRSRPKMPRSGGGVAAGTEERGRGPPRGFFGRRRRAVVTAAAALVRVEGVAPREAVGNHGRCQWGRRPVLRSAVRPLRLPVHGP